MHFFCKTHRLDRSSEEFTEESSIFAISKAMDIASFKTSPFSERFLEARSETIIGTFCDKNYYQLQLSFKSFNGILCSYLSLQVLHVVEKIKRFLLRLPVVYQCVSIFECFKGFRFKYSADLDEP